MKNKKPDWLKVRYDEEKVNKMNNLLDDLNLNTVCKEANCPNVGECFGMGSAAFMILGPLCTRNCHFCDVPHGKPAPVDLMEPTRVANAIKKLHLKHVCVTSTDRDDLRNDLGSEQFVRVIEAIRKENPSTTIEVLTPDFQGKEELVKKVVESRPDVFNHNVETVKRITPLVRDSRATYEQSLNVLRYAKKYAKKGTYIKTGIMLGLGEKDEEVYNLMDDLRKIGVDFLSIGQYIQPSPKHYPLQNWVSTKTFRKYYEKAMSKGFKFVASSPLVRSSYKASAEMLAVSKQK